MNTQNKEMLLKLEQVDSNGNVIREIERPYMSAMIILGEKAGGLGIGANGWRLSAKSNMPKESKTNVFNDINSLDTKEYSLKEIESMSVNDVVKLIKETDDVQLLNMLKMDDRLLVKKELQKKFIKLRDA